jgi:hypothetical protein
VATLWFTIWGHLGSNKCHSYNFSFQKGIIAMKRSDMVQSLASELIYAWLDVFGVEGLPDYGQAQYIANLMLKKAEREGMAPPEIKEFVEIPAHNILGAGFKVGHNVHKWEPEDEAE